MSIKKRGRPIGALSEATIVRRLAREHILVTDRGIERQVPIAEALLLKLRELALQGDLQAIKEADKYRERAEPDVPHKEAGVLLVPERPSPEQWIKEQEARNRFRTPPDMPESRIPAIVAPLSHQEPRAPSGPGSDHSTPRPQSRLIR